MDFVERCVSSMLEYVLKIELLRDAELLRRIVASAPPENILELSESEELENRAAFSRHRFTVRNSGVLGCPTSCANKIRRLVSNRLNFLAFAFLAFGVDVEYVLGNLRFLLELEGVTVSHNRLGSG
jgi:hypothetical protein